MNTQVPYRCRPWLRRSEPTRSGRGRNRVLGSCLLAWLAFLPPRVALPATYTVVPGGGGDFTEIQAAVDSAATGDTVLVASGTYTATSSRIDHTGGSRTAAVWLQPGLVLLSSQGAAMTTISAAADYGIYYDGNGSAQPVSVTGFSIAGPKTGIHFREGEGSIRDCRLSGFTTGIEANQAANAFLMKENLILGSFTSSGIVLASSDAAIEGNQVAGCGRGISLDAASTWTIQDGLFQENLTGIWMTGGAATNELTGNTIADNTTGLQAQSGAKGKFRYNLIARNAAFGINWSGTPGPGDVVFECNNVGINGVADYFGDLDTTGTSDNISVDPQFCGIASSGNLWLQSDSPCTDATSPCGVRIGALDVGCLATTVRKSTWGAIKRRYLKE